jgi:DNA modification methylase
VTPFVQDSDFTLHVGDVREQLAQLPDESVHCVVTSPPYWGLRDYQTASWDGGDPDCDHEPDAEWVHRRYLQSSGLAGNGPSKTQTDAARVQWFKAHGGNCPCGATRVDQQLGLEPTPEQYVANMVAVFREVRRVLRRDGTCWVNLGDSYAQAGGSQMTDAERDAMKERGERRGYDKGNAFMNYGAGIDRAAKTAVGGLKQKDLCGIPWRVAFALQADGWYLRSDIIWAKPNPMPESVTDRPTKAHEYVFLLTRSPRYFFDSEAVREPHKNFERGANGRRVGTVDERPEPGVRSGTLNSMDRDGARREYNPAGRNIRSVWELATQPYPEAHFATFPEALPERCIKAGTSERGCCPECGAPWEREVDISQVPHPSGGSKGRATQKPGANNWDGVQIRTSKHVATTGWEPTCDCWVCPRHGMTKGGPQTCTECEASPRTPEPVPCTVLDPFMGSGTTALVARRLGRRSIGVELNPEYAALCARRLQQLSLLSEVNQ